MSRLLPVGFRMISPTHHAVPSFRGVYEADPHTPPLPPPGAQAVEIKDRTGRTIAWGWVVAEHADAAFRSAAWDHLDARDNCLDAFTQIGAASPAELPSEPPSGLPSADQEPTSRPALHLLP